MSRERTKGNTFLLPDNYIYISHLDEDLKFWRLPFYPDTVSDTMESTFQSQSALGRSAPVYTFSHAGPRTVRFEIALHRDIMDDTNFGYSNAILALGEDYLDNLIHALQTIAVPKYNLSNKAVEPPLVAVRLGKDLFIKGVVTSGIGITYTKPILDNEKYAQVNLSIDIAEVDPYDATTVYKNGSFRGQVRTLREGAYNYLGIEDR